jgi:hypothetical protein
MIRSRVEKKSQNCPTHLSNFPKFIAAALSNGSTALPKVPLRRFRSKRWLTFQVHNDWFDRRSAFHNPPQAFRD